MRVTIPTKELAPRGFLQRIENGVAGVAKAAGEFERPNSFLVNDRIEIDVSAVSSFLEQWRHAPQRLDRERGPRARK